MNNLLLKNCSIKNTKFDLLITGGIITEISDSINITDTEIIDANNLTLIPGLIDIHTQGAGGYDILDSNPEGISKMSQTLAAQGTTSFLATSVYKNNTGNSHLGFTAGFTGKNKLPGAEIIGIHLEGPFINSDKLGGINTDSYIPPSLNVLNNVLDATNGALSLMTLAPELDNMNLIIPELIKSNVIPSLGHSNCNFEVAEKSFSNGISHVTHLFNALPGINHRAPGPITAIFLNEIVTAQIISDGVHLDPNIVKLIFNNIELDRCICITDGMQATGLPEGEYFYNNKKYIAKNGSAKYENGTLIGCTLSLLEIVKRFNQFTGCGFDNALLTATENPAKLLGIKKGKIEVGYDADLILLDNHSEVQMTFVSGRLVYSRN